MVKVVVGLGNPGKNYEGTRHNIGFAVIDLLAQSFKCGPFQEKLGGLVVDLRDGEDKVLLVKPQTFMNLSGRCVNQVLTFFKISQKDLLVVCDDLNLPVGKIRLRAKGSHGGNNGLRDIQGHLGEDYSRLKIGIGGAREGQAVSHVLGKFSPSEKKAVTDSVILSTQASQCWWKEGIEAAMNRFNGGMD